jgi:hypothetical protein
MTPISRARERWISEEAQLGAIARLAFTRARRRPALTLALALGATAALVGWRAWKAPAYEARLTFSMTEGEVVEPGAGLRPPRSIAEYLSTVVLSRERLGRLMEKHGISRARRAHDPVSAIEDFRREDISIEVTRNYFVFDRRPGDPPRSAHLIVALTGSDPERTRALLHDIGQAIVDDQAEDRADLLAAERTTLEGRLAWAQARSRSLEQRIAVLSEEAGHADKGDAIVLRARVASLALEHQDALEQVLELERHRGRVEFVAAAEGKKLGVRLELVDESLLVRSRRLTPWEMAALAPLVFALALLLVAPVVGAFDDRVYAAEDLELRGLPLLGALSRFPGDDQGSYRARLADRSA